MLQVDVPVFHYGDVVRVLDDMVQVHSLQTGHGDWNDDMALVNKFNNSSQQYTENSHVVFQTQLIDARWRSQWYK